MKTKLIASRLLRSILHSTFFILPFAVSAATNDLSSALQQGLFEEEANRNLPAAISAYEAVSRQFDKNRALAATAVFRLGECYRKQGQTNEAAAHYERVLRDFADQQQLVTLSRQNLAGMGMTPPAPVASAAPPLSRASRQEQAKLLEQQIKLAEQDAIAAKQMVEVGRMTQGEARSKEREVLSLRQQLAALDLTAESVASKDTKPATTSVVIDEEETEIRRLQAMIRNSPDLINAPSGGPGDNYTPLGRAANKGQLRVAQFLLDSGAEVNRAYESRTPLLLAATRGHKAMIELLLARGADINARGNNNSRTALHIAAENGFQATAEALIAGKADVNARTTKQETPLHLAVSAGHMAMTKFLLSKGADVDARDSNGGTALMLAASRGHLETLQALLAAGAKPNLENEYGATALYGAAEKGNLDCVKALLAAKADPNAGGLLPLHVAIHAKATGVVQALLEAGADANRAGQVTWQVRVGNSTYGSGMTGSLLTPLFIAINEANADATKLLLSHKADPNGLGPDRLPVILKAAWYPAVLEPLLKAGAKPNVDDGEGRTPLIFATADGVTESVRLLLANGAEKEVQPFGQTPLLISVSRGDQKSAELLIQAGANINARMVPAGDTALHLAVSRKDPALTALLLGNKADVNARNRDGFTPLDYAKGNQSGPGLSLSGGMLRPGMAPIPMAVSPGKPAAQPVAPPTSITDLLRQHGALDELPDFTSIRVNRQGLEKPIVVFHQQTNGWNRFTLLETVLGYYADAGLVSFQQAYGALGGQNLNPEPNFQARLQTIINRSGNSATTLWFPDLKRIIVHRPSRTPGGKEQAIPVNLLNATNGVDCAKDMPLEFGDVVEIPVRDHALSESPSALSVPETAGMLGCLQRKVRLTVRGETREIQLRPVEAESPLRKALGKPESKALLLSSSDLTRVKVTRKEPSTGKAREFIVDTTKTIADSDDLWLRDGDVVEVPEK